MTISALIQETGARALSLGEDREICSGYVCDLLSHVMSHGVADMAWVTVQTHMNVIAVATLLDFACVIVPEGIAVDEAIAQRAAQEGVTVLSTDMTAYEIAVYLAKNGVGAAKKQ